MVIMGDFLDACSDAGKPVFDFDGFIEAYRFIFEICQVLRYFDTRQGIELIHGIKIIRIINIRQASVDGTAELIGRSSG